MRALLIPSALIAAFAAVPAAASSGCAALPSPPADAAPSPPLVAIAPEEARSPVRLAPLADDSPWRARFEAAADELFPALQSRQADRWQPLLGGRWLGDADRQAVATLLGDQCGAFAPLLVKDAPVERRILGWILPTAYSSAERAEIAARSEAEALVCWSARPDGAAAWPKTAAEADNAPGRSFACARITYSVRGGMPSWRAFIERGARGSGV